MNDTSSKFERFKAERVRQDALRAELEIGHKTDSMPEWVRNLIWRKAWDDGHASGFHEIEMHYEDLAEIAHAAMEAKK